MKKAILPLVILICMMLSACQLVYRSLDTGSYSQSRAEREFPQLLTENRAQVSPSGTFLMEYEKRDTETRREYTFVVYSNDAAHEKIYESDRVLLPYFTCFVMWDEILDRVWMYDGDSGLYFAQQDENGSWQRFAQWGYEGEVFWRKEAAGEDQGVWFDAEEMKEQRANAYPHEVKVPELLVKLRPHLENKEAE